MCIRDSYIPHDMSFAGSALKQGYRNLDGTSAEFFVRCRHGQGYSNSDIDRLNMQRYFYAGLFKRVRSMGITDVLNQLPLIFNNPRRWHIKSWFSGSVEMAPVLLSFSRPPRMCI